MGEFLEVIGDMIGELNNRVSMMVGVSSCLTSTHIPTHGSSRV